MIDNRNNQIEIFRNLAGFSIFKRLNSSHSPNVATIVRLKASTSLDSLTTFRLSFIPNLLYRFTVRDKVAKRAESVAINTGGINPMFALNPERIPADANTMLAFCSISRLSSILCSKTRQAKSSITSSNPIVSAQSSDFITLGW